MLRMVICDYRIRQTKAHKAFVVKNDLEKEAENYARRTALQDILMAHWHRHCACKQAMTVVYGSIRSFYGTNSQI
jgi:hypothetical protein